MKFNRDLLQEKGRLLLEPSGLNNIRWPSPEIQRAYTGADGAVLLNRTIDFIEKLVECVPKIKSDDWRGLDYGVGFGRIASLLTLFGDPSQLTCVDAWEKSLELARECGITNPAFRVPSMISVETFATGVYDFVYAYSIFTHLPKPIFLHNAQIIMNSLKPGGVFVLTVREPKFIEFLKRSNKFVSDDDIDADGYWFGNMQSNDYGDTVVSSHWIEANLEKLGKIKYIGVVPSEPFQFLIALTRE